MLLAQITDLHIRPEGQLVYRRIDTASYLNRAVAHLNDLSPRPDVVLITGDLVDSGKPQAYSHLRELLKPLIIPYFVIPGNHVILSFCERHLPTTTIFTRTTPSSTI
jgi:Icc protein